MVYSLFVKSGVYGGAHEDKANGGVLAEQTASKHAQHVAIHRSLVHFIDDEVSVILEMLRVIGQQSNLLNK